MQAAISNSNNSRSPVYFAALFLLVLIGFYPSYFGRLAQLDFKHHFHGMVATVWMLMLVLQSWLATHRRLDIHRTIGKLSMVIAPLFIISGILIMQVMLSSKNGFSKAFGSRLAFVDITTMMGFATAYCLAIHYRRTRALHSRWMACTALLAFPPAAARIFGNFIPGINSFPASFHAGYFLTDIILLGLIAHDLRLGKYKTPFWMVLGIMILQQLSFIVLPHIPQWQAVTDFLAG
ncbi:hypothetical protein ACO0LD_26930 [Undibacterium sp. Ji83W]|uniref:hypothetical protein n=1 Tax=Undibacterium sp. Ji83W TaxID=3413043 RepID=UPI003BF0B27B